MDSQQSSIEGQVIIKAVGRILSKASIPSQSNTPEVISLLFDTFAKKLDEYKKKDQEKL